MDDKVVLGFLEEVTVVGTNGETRTVVARIDTGAQNSSIDLTLAQELRLGPITNVKSIRSSHGKSLRPVVSAQITVAKKQISADFTLYNRSHMRYKLLIGQNILKKGFLIDPSKVTVEEKKIKKKETHHEQKV